MMVELQLEGPGVCRSCGFDKLLPTTGYMRGSWSHLEPLCSRCYVMLRDARQHRGMVLLASSSPTNGGRDG